MVLCKASSEQAGCDRAASVEQGYYEARKEMCDPDITGCTVMSSYL